jgi:oxalate decarboxylase
MSKPVLILVSMLLTWAAGFVDAVGFLALGHIYTANMSGNSIAVGIQTFNRNWPEALIRFWPVAAYVAGLLFCRVLLEFGARRRIRRIATVTLALEILLLALVCFGRAHAVATTLPAAVSIGFLAVAMGIQNGTLTHFSFVTVHTGFVTGTLVKLAEELARYIGWVWDATGGRHARLRDVMRLSTHQESFGRSVLLAVLWIAYVLGALGGAFGNSLASLRALAVPAVGLAAVICLDLRSPLAVKEEQAQIEGPPSQ